MLLLRLTNGDHRGGPSLLWPWVWGRCFHTRGTTLSLERLTVLAGEAPGLGTAWASALPSSLPALFRPLADPCPSEHWGIFDARVTSDLAHCGVWPWFSGSLPVSVIQDPFMPILPPRQESRVHMGRTEGINVTAGCGELGVTWRRRALGSP